MTALREKEDLKRVPKGRVIYKVALKQLIRYQIKKFSCRAAALLR